MPHLLPGLLAAFQGMSFSSNFHSLTHPLSHLSHPSGLPETLPVSFIWLLLLDVFFWMFFSLVFCIRSLLSLFPFGGCFFFRCTRRAVVCSCVVVATGASSSVLNHLYLVSLILLQAVSSEEYYNNNRTVLFFLSFFRFFFGGCFLGSRKHHNFVANFVKWQRGCWELMELLHTWFRDWWDGDYIFIVALVWSTHEASSCSAWELLVVVIVLSSAHILVIGGTGSISSAAASLVEITPQRIGYLSLVFFFVFVFSVHVCVCALCFPSVGWRCFCLFVCLFSLLLLHESLENGFWKMGFSKSLVI